MTAFAQVSHDVCATLNEVSFQNKLDVGITDTVFFEIFHHYTVFYVIWFSVCTINVREAKYLLLFSYLITNCIILQIVLSNQNLTIASKFSMIHSPAAVFCEVIAYSSLDCKQHICINQRSGILVRLYINVKYNMYI